MKLQALMLETTGAAIATLAFDEFVKSGAGKVAKEAVGGAIEQLRSTIKQRFLGNRKAEAAIHKVKQAERQYNNYGRDQINIDSITGNPRIGGS